MAWFGWRKLRQEVFHQSISLLSQSYRNAVWIAISWLKKLESRKQLILIIETMASRKFSPINHLIIQSSSFAPMSAMTIIIKKSQGITISPTKYLIVTALKLPATLQNDSQPIAEPSSILVTSRGFVNQEAFDQPINWKLPSRQSTAGCRADKGQSIGTEM